MSPTAKWVLGFVAFLIVVFVIARVAGWGLKGA